MDRRTLLALLLTAIVIVVTPMLFKTPPRRPTPVVVDTAAARDTAQRSAPTPTPPAIASAAPAPRTIGAAAARVPATVRPETTVVRTNRAVYALVSPGGTPANVTLPEYRSLRAGTRGTAPLQLIEDGDRLFHLAIASDRDTIDLDTVTFRPEPQRRGGDGVIQQTLVGSLPGLRLAYRFHPDSFVVQLDAVIGDVAGRRMIVTLPSRIRSEEADLRDDIRHLAFAYRKRASEVENIPFRNLDSAAARSDTGAIRWVSARNKYFVVAAIPAGPDSMFSAVVSRGAGRTGGEATHARAMAILPVNGSGFSLRVYAGPQSWDHMRQTVADLENVNPYGGWMHGLVQPFATIVMRMLLWMRHTFAVGYGWVLVMFGVAVRLLLWPLNQNAMRSSMKMQRLQPELAELQKKYKDNPERQRDAIMKLYQEHGMSPFSPLLGCLPMLLPMPILFALYFVFQNTIEFRGVPFLWLPDLSLRDPYFITPLIMGASMFLLSWIGMRGMPPSPQGKMMSYLMPVMFTVLFWNFASGLNLYYAVQNIAALPQQWLLARERVSKGTADPGKGSRPK
jgi:YidC/Oxa1 family membrane protein insertase